MSLKERHRYHWIKNHTKRTDQVPKNRSENPAPTLQEIEKAFEELAMSGVIEDTGKRHNGKVVWRLSEIGRNITRGAGDAWEIAEWARVRGLRRRGQLGKEDR